MRALNRLNRLFKEELEGVFVRCMFFGLLGIWNMEYMGGGVGGVAVYRQRIKRSRVLTLFYRVFFNVRLLRLRPRLSSSQSV